MSSTHDSLSGPDEGTTQSQTFIPATGESYINLPVISLGTRNIAVAEAIAAESMTESPAIAITEVIT